jgi:hypothetical protein
MFCGPGWTVAYKSSKRIPQMHNHRGRAEADRIHKRYSLHMKKLGAETWAFTQEK